MNKHAKIYVAGHRGMVGSAIVRLLKTLGHTHIIEKTHAELDLTDHNAVRSFFESEHPDYVFMAAAKVGGIYANNTFPADFIYTNLTIQNNVIYESHRIGVKKLMFLGSSCIYPKFATQPIDESALLTGALEPTNEPYAIAKIAGIVLCQSFNRQYGTQFISVMPTNLYGLNDNYDLKTSHVLPALIRKIHEAKVAGAKEVEVWGTGKPLREFLYADDLADACVFLMHTYTDSSIVNIGTGVDITIADLAKEIQDAIGFKGRLVFNPAQPDGTPRKLLNVSKLTSLGWKAKTPLSRGISLAYQDYLNS